MVEEDKLEADQEEMGVLEVEHLVPVQEVEELVILLLQIHLKVMWEVMPQDHHLKQVLVVEVL